MSLASAMNTALTGLSSSETQIDVIGNNLANANTLGFKASEVAFATQFLQTQSVGASPTATTGGLNPVQTGLGLDGRRDHAEFLAGHDLHRQQPHRPGHPGRRVLHRPGRRQPAGTLHPRRHLHHELREPTGHQHRQRG